MNIDDSLQLQRCLSELENWAKMANGVHSFAKCQFSK